MAPFLTRLRPVLLLVLFTSIAHALQAQASCANTSSLSNGYTTSITSVTANANGTHTIVLTVLNNGCSGCKKLNSLTVQAAPGTYSNIVVQLLSGAFTWASISMGPTLSGTSVTGFRINNTNGIGNGQAAAFTVTYTLSGPLQNQQVQLKTASNTLVASFTAANFQGVLNCLAPPQPQVIFPLFDPYANKSFDIIGVELTSLYLAYSSSGSYISNDIFQILGSSVRISIRTKPGQHANAVSLLTGPAYGLVQELNDPANNLINGTFPILNLLSLNLLPTLLVSARPIYAPLSNVGLMTSQGDTALRSYRAREVFGVNGQGIKVGVLSDSYNTKPGNPAADDVLRKDLPGVTNTDHPTPVDVLLDFPFGTRSDEGRAMLQIVHDVAPGADLAFRTGFLGPVDFAKGIRDLQVAGCDVIVDDITYISEPFFRDGVIAQAVDEVKGLGVSYFSAAGNFGTNSWQGTFAPTAAPTGVTGQAHNFASGAGGTDILQNITLYQGTYTIVFQWDDGTPGLTTNSDFDIYLANNSGNTLFGFNRMSIGSEPVEVLPFLVTADSVQSNIVVVRAAGTGAAQLKYIVYRGQLKINEYSTLSGSTITGQANAAGAIAVGAVLYSNTPEYGVNPPTIASFSSRGGTPVNGVNRAKPEICAPNGVNTSVDLGGVNIDGDAFPNFFGTSAAAPHAAGVAALLSHARDKYYGGSLAPDQVKAILQNSAIDMGSPGYDVATGAGYILADRALANLANPTAYITSIFYDTTLTPGTDTIVLTIYGEYLTPASTVWLDGAPLTSGVVIQGDTAIVTIVQPFDALYPSIQVYNPPMAGTNGLDGGLSNPLYFTTKETILVRVDNKAKKYGQVLPEFTAIYTLESVNSSSPLASSGLAQHEIDRVHNIGLTSIADALSNVGLWAITADPTDPLNPNSTIPATDSLDLSLLQRYNFVIQNGLLTIDPMDLKITPRDTTFVYNDSISALSYDYEFNGDPATIIPINASDSITILNAIRGAHGTALVNGLGVVRGTALVNSDGLPLLTDSLLRNFSFMISQALRTTRGTALVNGELIDPDELYTYATALSNSTSRLVRGTALVNGYTLVRGTALVNNVDSMGNVTNTSPLTNAGSLVNNSGILNSTTITLDSNTETVVILGEDDIAILSGDSAGNVVMRSVSLITGNTVGTHLSIPGTFLSNNFMVSYGIGNVTILPDTAEFTIDAASLTQVYDGSPKTIGVTVEPDSVAFTVTYNGNTTPPVNAGTYAVEVTVDDPNYVGSASATMVIQQAPAQVTIMTGTLTQTYDGSPKSVGVSILPAGLAHVITYGGSTTPPVNAGSYAVQVTVTDPNYVGAASSTLVIQKATAQITLSGTTQVYNATPRSVGISVVPAGLSYAITYNGSATPPVNAGSYAVQVTINDPNHMGTASATLVVQKAPATATTGIYVINKNAPLPSFTATYSGFLAGQTASVVTSVSFTTSPNYTGNTGVYQIIVNATAANYTFTSVNGTLYVNPTGAGTKQVKPTFICYMVQSPPVNGFSRVSYFNYQNPNSTPVYIPVGPNNFITASSFDGSEQPVLFLPGTSAPIAIPHNGTSITWQVTSNKNNNTTGSIPANSSNVVCSSPGIKTLIEVEEAPLEVRVYPNPSSGVVYLEFPEIDVNGASVEVFSALGTRCAVQVGQTNDQRMELDLSAYGRGVYLIQVIQSGERKSYRVVIE
ncbi:MAG: S8 family serine peptidase [Flavobacteriales bacterium]|nr:S8 family serine peptidase [Flavobacteriales bacterium]